MTPRPSMLATIFCPASRAGHTGDPAAEYRRRVGPAFAARRPWSRGTHAIPVQLRIRAAVALWGDRVLLLIAASDSQGGDDALAVSIA